MGLISRGMATIAAVVLAGVVTGCEGDQADLSVNTFYSDPEPVSTGAELTYYADAVNYGPATAQNAIANMVLDPGTEFVAASSSRGACSGESGTVTCRFGDVGSGQVADLTVKVRVTAPPQSTLFAQVTFSSDTPDPTTNNRADFVSKVVNKGADLYLYYSSVEPEPVPTGSELTYYAAMTNLGPDIGSNVTAAMVLPYGTQLIEVSSTQGACSGVAGSVSCDYGDVGPHDGGDITVRALVTAPSGSTLTADVEFFANNDDDVANNRATFTSTVVGWG